MTKTIKYPKTLKDLVYNDCKYTIKEISAIKVDEYYIMPHNIMETGYEDYIVFVSPKQFTKVREELERYERKKQSPLYKKLTGVND